MLDAEWWRLNTIAKATIMLTCSDDIVMSIGNEATAWDVWQRLQTLYAQQSASSKVFWLKKLVHLQMKEGQSILAHLNEFSKTFSHVIQHGLSLDDEVKSSLLLVSLPPSWDTFVTATSNSHHLQVYADVEGAIMQEDMNRQNRAGSKASSAMYVRGADSRTNKKET